MVIAIWKSSKEHSATNCWKHPMLRLVAKATPGGSPARPPGPWPPSTEKALRSWYTLSRATPPSVWEGRGCALGWWRYWRTLFFFMPGTQGQRGPLPCTQCLWKRSLCRTSLAILSACQASHRIRPPPLHHPLRSSQRPHAGGTPGWRAWLHMRIILMF